MLTLFRSFLPNPLTPFPDSLVPRREGGREGGTVNTYSPPSLKQIALSFAWAGKGVGGLGEKVALFRTRHRNHLAFQIVMFLSIVFTSSPSNGAQPVQVKQQTPSAVRNQLLAADVVATVAAETISRRELTYYWMQLDPRVNGHLGELLTAQWRTAKGNAKSYSISESAIYQRLFKDPNIEFAPILASLVNTKIVEIEARHKGIIITETQAAAFAHEQFDQIRQQRNTTMSDDQLMTLYKVPKDLFMMDMRTKIRQDRLLQAEISKKLGHSIGPNDWIFTRQLFAAAGANAKLGEKPSEQDFTEAKIRLVLWSKELQSGKTLEDVARAHNEDFTRAYGGLRGPSLRGTGTKGLEDAIWSLKGSEYSIPLRGRLGWYIFKIERRGEQTTEPERKQLWQQISDSLLPNYLISLRKSVKVTSVVPLPTNPAPANFIPALDAALELPPAPPAVPGK